MHTSTQRAHMTNIMNELASMRIVDNDNINDHVIHVNNQLQEIIFSGNILSEEAKCYALRSSSKYLAK